MADSVKNTRTDEAQEAHRQFIMLAIKEAARREERAKRIWKAAYIVAGFVMLSGFVWMLLGGR